MFSFQLDKIYVHWLARLILLSFHYLWIRFHGDTRSRLFLLFALIVRVFFNLNGKWVLVEISFLPKYLGFCWIHWYSQITQIRNNGFQCRITFTLTKNTSKIKRDFKKLTGKIFAFEIMCKSVVMTDGFGSKCIGCCHKWFISSNKSADANFFLYFHTLFHNYILYVIIPFKSRNMIDTFVFKTNLSLLIFHYLTVQLHY